MASSDALTEKRREVTDTIPFWVLFLCAIAVRVPSSMSRPLAAVAAASGMGGVHS